jgi:hypothetical protein
VTVELLVYQALGVDRYLTGFWHDVENSYQDGTYDASMRADGRVAVIAPPKSSLFIEDILCSLSL